MRIDEFLNSEPMKRAMAVGEERVGRMVTQLLSNERFMTGVQTFFSSALTAKSTFDRGVKTALQAVSLPTTEDVAELRQRLSELEAMIDGLAARVGAGAAEGRGRGGAAGEGGANERSE